MAQIWLEWYFPELGNEVLNFLEDDIPAIALAISLKRIESTKECFVFFRDGKQREERIWLHSLACDHPWFEDMGIHQASTHWKDLTTTRVVVYAHRGVSCLTSTDFFFGEIHTDKKCHYGVGACNPQFVSKQFGMV